MIGDHHGRTAGRATLLVTAVDGILGTHTAGAPKPGKPGPGRLPGSKNRRPAARHDVGKNLKKTTAGKAVSKKTG
jgi:hypothetical protein